MQRYAQILSSTHSLSKVLVSILYHSLEHWANGSTCSIDIDHYFAVIDNTDLEGACLTT